MQTFEYNFAICFSCNHTKPFHDNKTYKINAFRIVKCIIAAHVSKVANFYHYTKVFVRQRWDSCGSGCYTNNFIYYCISSFYEHSYVDDLKSRTLMFANRRQRGGFPRNTAKYRKRLKPRMFSNRKNVI
jgi:hypothetical protein